MSELFYSGNHFLSHQVGTSGERLALKERFLGDLEKYLSGLL